MGSKQKAKEFLEVSRTHEHYSTIVEQSLKYFITKAEQEKPECADYLRKLQTDYKEQFKEAIDITEQVYADIFTDDELDELIVMHRNPTLLKLRGLTADISDKTIDQYAQ